MREINKLNKSGACVWKGPSFSDVFQKELTQVAYI